jgi:hypothetical protein
MRRRTLFVAALCTLAMAALVAATTASAASPHFKKGGTPTCTITSGTSSASVVCRGSLAGLGNGDVDLATTVSGFAVYQCQNGGGNTAPGQNRVLTGPVTEPTHIPGNEIKNGNLTFVTNPATLTAPSTVSGAAAGCPNPNWTGVNPQLTVTDISLTISQGGTLLFTCTASNPSGFSSGTVALSC